MPVTRIDRGSLRKPKRLPNGYLRADGYLTRVGVFEYRNADGSLRRELRLPSEVFSPESLASFEQVPLTNDHPPEMLDAKNTRQYACGVVSSPRADGALVRGDILVMDAELVEAMENGKSEVSCGYRCDLDETPGVYQGKPYDVVQRNIRGNHVAVVAAGRAGAEVRVRMDGAEMVGAPAAPFEPKERPMFKVTINGIEFEVSTEAAKQAIEKALGEATSRADREAARADTAEDKLKKAEKARKDAADSLPSLVAARVALVAVAAPVLGDVKLDSKTDREIKVAVIEKLSGKKVDENASDDYVAARLDTLLERDVDEANERVTRAAKPTPVEEGREDEQDLDEDTAREKNRKDHRDAWKKPIPGSARRDDK